MNKQEIEEIEKELLDIVDENNIIIGKDTRRNKMLKGFISRNIVLYLFDRNNKLLLAKRSANKRVMPNYIDAPVCGHVTSGQTYEEAAQRELKEELGLTCDLKKIRTKLNEFDVAENHTKLKYFSSVFFGKFFGELKSNGEHSEFLRVSVKELKELIERGESQGKLISPGLKWDFEIVKEHMNKLE